MTTEPAISRACVVVSRKLLLYCAFPLVVAGGIIARSVPEAAPQAEVRPPDRLVTQTDQSRRTLLGRLVKSARSARAAGAPQDRLLAVRAESSDGPIAPSAQSADAGSDDALDRWSQEAADPEATDALGEHIEDALHDLEISGELLDLSCRRTLCSVRMRFPDLAAATAFSEQASAPERRQRLAIARDDEDRVVVTALVLRAP